MSSRSSGSVPSGQISSRQLGALALTAAGLPIFRFCCRVSWPWVLLGGLAAAGTLSALTAILNRRRANALPLGRRRPVAYPGADEAAHDRRSGLRFAAASVLAAPLLLAGALYAAWESSFAFPETAGNLLCAALVLVLSAAAAFRGPTAAGRCAGILLRITGALYGTVLLFSLPEIKPAWLAPTGRPAEALKVWAALALPGAALCLTPALPEGERIPYWPWVTAAGLAAAASAVTGGILSPALARDPEAFRTLARGVSVVGVIRRFEALVNGALLMSGFCLCTLLLTAFRSLPEGWKRPEKFFEKSQKKC